MGVVTFRRRARAVKSAGASAEALFKERRALWRNGRRNPLGAALILLTVPSLVVAILTHGIWRWEAVFLLGFNFGIGLWVWDSPPFYIEKWRRGSKGEKATAKQLAQLPDSWTVEHDIDCGRGNWDHVVVGPPGAFLIDSKNLMGNAAVEGGVLVLRRAEDPDEVSRFENLPGRIRGQALAVRDRLVKPGQRLWVTGVVAVWPELAGGVVEGDRIFYVSGPELHRWLQEQPARQSPTQVSDLATALNEGIGHTQ